MTSSVVEEYDFLLGPSDPYPVEVINPDSDYPVVLVCEHAGNLVPAQLQNLGLSQAELEQHIAWDIGAEKTARKLADELGATLILQRYSRLVIDCNRPPDSAGSILTMSDGVPINNNLNVSLTARQQRIEEIFNPFQQAVTDSIAQPSCKIALSIHSYTRTMNDFIRPWDIGFLYRHDEVTSASLFHAAACAIPSDRIGMNQPYQVDDSDDWFIPKQGEASGKYHSLIEICNDQIDTESGQKDWGHKLATMIRQTVKRIIS